MISGMNYSETIEKNKILSQNPNDGSIALADETVQVIMSGGQEEVMMPDLAGMTREEAQQLITGQNLTIGADGINEEYSDVVEKGRVITQSIPADERIAVQTQITLAVSLGSLNEETALLEVPDLTGMTKEKALKQLEKLKEQAGFTFVLGEVKNKYSAEVEKGKIISQKPKAGKTVRTNEPIRVVLSKGPEMVQIPELVYLTKDQAIGKLEKAGLQAEVVTEYSEQAAAGLVIRQSGEAGAKAAKGSSVTITVSLGKQPVQQSGGSAGNSGNSGNTGNNRPSGGSTGNNGAGSSNGGGQSSSGNVQTQPDNSDRAGDSDGNRAIMPDGGSFVVE
ncbi:hypothetical protein C823_006362 [Eubacterium plexicaudatum ASF492]|nr:hypothetical protein C823_006362 [Eubacterium plexicaudatum ASF492]